jgi:hypothetical protein
VAGDLALARVGDVGGVVIEGGEGADHADHDRHRMRIAAEAAEQEAELFVHHRVEGDGVVEFLHLLARRQLALQEQIADLEKAGMMRQLIDGVSAIEQDARVAVDIGDVAFAAGRGGEARVVGEDVRFAVELADIDDIGPDRAGEHRKLVGPVPIIQGRLAGGLRLAFLIVHQLTPSGGRARAGKNLLVRGAAPATIVR